MKKFGFSLMELLIAMVIIGIIAIIMLSTIRNTMPNEEQIMFKKAYGIASRTISEMINDDDMYWDSSDDDGGVGFANTQATIADITGASTPNPSGDGKFCILFASFINATTGASCTSHSKMSAGSAPSGYSFKSHDGMTWQLPYTNFGGSSANENDYYNIIVDVNGDKGGNCFDGEKDCKKPDRFIIEVNYLGALKVPGSIARAYLSENKTTRSYAEYVSDQQAANSYVPLTTEETTQAPGKASGSN